MFAVMATARGKEVFKSVSTRKGLPHHHRLCFAEEAAVVSQPSIVEQRRRGTSTNKKNGGRIERPLVRLSADLKVKHKGRVIGGQYPILPHPSSPPKAVTERDGIPLPSYVLDPTLGKVGKPTEWAFPLPPETIHALQRAGKVSRSALQLAISTVENISEEDIVTTDDIDDVVHCVITEAKAYPSPLQYGGFPKSVFTSVNEIVCHGKPDSRPLRLGDVVSIDVWSYVCGVHVSACGSAVVGAGDEVERKSTWVGDEDDESQESRANNLVIAARESIRDAINACRPGGCHTDIGQVIEDRARERGFQVARALCRESIDQPLQSCLSAKAFRNKDKFELEPGMVFSVRPTLLEGSTANVVWDDGWTVSTVDGGMSAQVKELVMVTESEPLVLTGLTL